MLLMFSLSLCFIKSQNFEKFLIFYSSLSNNYVYFLNFCGVIFSRLGRSLSLFELRVESRDEERATESRSKRSLTEWHFLPVEPAMNGINHY